MTKNKIRTGLQKRLRTNQKEKNSDSLIALFLQPVTEFKEFNRRFKFKPRFKYGWFHLKLYQMFQDLSWRLI